ncbi:MAG: valine--tRNA ligase, partial [Pseudonocardiaceae bacterium]
YKHLIGKMVTIPLVDRDIPIIADPNLVDPNFGTGAVKVTPAHDPNDFEIGRRHDLLNLTIMDERGVITAHGPFEGLDRFEARPAVVAALRAEGRVVAEKRPYPHAVGHCSRCDTVVEPRLSLQWFVRVEPLARAAGEAVRDGRTTIHPPELAKRYFDWVDNMHDWCISRQLWWGHRIPVWYGPDSQVICVGPDEQPPTGEGWQQDPDVLDTWFSSGLWPFSTLGWPDRTADLERFYPTSVLVTGYDILFFWVVRMMMFGLYAMDGQPPFHDVFLHGLIRDASGKKMSKSRGNVIDPLQWLDRYGADSLRFTLARGANPGADMALTEEWARGSRNFCNKLWNASRFALMNGAITWDVPDRARLTDADTWILDRADALVAEVDGLFEGFQFGKLCEALYHFVWDEFCDWYVELAKVQLAEGGHRAEDTRAVLGHVLDVVLRLLHPVAPFVTETLWTVLTGRESIVVAAWPTSEGRASDSAAARRVEDVQKLVTVIRRFRSDQGLKPAQRVAARLFGMGAAGLAAHDAAARALTWLDDAAESFTLSASLEVSLTGGVVTVEIDMLGAVDTVAERRRLAKDLAAAEKDLATAEAKLRNPAFTANAPDAVVDKIRARQQAAAANIERIAGRLAALPG